MLTAALILAHLIASGAAFARVQNFTHFSIDVADGWTATEAEDTSVSIFSPDKKTIVYILVTPRESPRKLDDVAKFRQGLENEGVAVSQSQQVDDDVYLMNGMRNNVPCVAAISFSGDWATCLMHIDPQDKYERAFERMMESIEDR